ncbi:MAG: hypothetical protein ACFCVD_18640 [Nodosilinea sp.]
MTAMSTPEPTLQGISDQIQRLSDKFTTDVNKLTADVDKLTADVEERFNTVEQRFNTLEQTVERSNEKFDTYQRATQWVVQLAFTLIASATITVILSTVLR